MRFFYDNFQFFSRLLIWGYTITMCYDVMDRLVSRTEGRGTTRMTYDLDGKLISQINPNELQARRDAAKGFRYYYDSKERNTGILSPEDQMVYKAVYDRQGSITHVLSEDAEILNHYSYDAFGNIIEKTEKVENRFCYNGEMIFGKLLQKQIMQMNF